MTKKLVKSIQQTIQVQQAKLDNEYNNSHYRTLSEVSELYKLEGEIRALNRVLKELNDG